MKKPNNQEIREEVLQSDKQKDFSVYLAVAIGTMAFFAAVCGAGEVAVMKALQSFRAEVDGYWIAGMPLIFPVVTGVAAGYHRRRAALGVHVGILIFAIMGASSAYGYSVEVVYQRNSTCTPMEIEGDCYRPNMAILYLAFGGAGLSACLFGLLCSCCACKQATRRIAQRKHQAEVEEHRRRAAIQEAKKLEARKLTEQRFAFVSQSASSDNLKAAAEGKNHPMTNLREENGYVNHAMSQSEISTKL